MSDQGDPLGAAQQRPHDEITTQAKRPIKEEIKDPETIQIVQPTGGAAMNEPSIDAPPRVNQ